ncbi:292_t:CDS:2 [Paraglomus occultum]|uniref:Cofilin n=1 Tax=Paraglomus occultum TaxID=144539 RepID=A0A9N9BDR5_9GLOM|nr:292_t:CDS:2 [Paraglomus occultum]
MGKKKKNYGSFSQMLGTIFRLIHQLCLLFKPPSPQINTPSTQYQYIVFALACPKDNERLLCQNRRSAKPPIFVACDQLPGVSVAPECLEVFQELKLKKKYRYVIFRISDDQTSIIFEKGAETASYDDFIGALPPNEPRYAIYDFDYETAEGLRNKLLFYSWTPDTSKIRSKMLYASSKDALRRSLVGIGTEIQATDFSEVSLEAVQEKVSR